MGTCACSHCDHSRLIVQVGKGGTNFLPTGMTRKSMPGKLRSDGEWRTVPGKIFLLSLQVAYNSNGPDR